MLLIKLSISLLLILLDKTELHVDPHITTGVQPYQLKQSCLITDLISPAYYKINMVTVFVTPPNKSINESILFYSVKVKSMLKCIMLRDKVGEVDGLRKCEKRHNRQHAPR